MGSQFMLSGPEPTTRSMTVQDFARRVDGPELNIAPLQGCEGAPCCPFHVQPCDAYMGLTDCVYPLTLQALRLLVREPCLASPSLSKQCYRLSGLHRAGGLVAAQVLPGAGRRGLFALGAD